MLTEILEILRQVYIYSAVIALVLLGVDAGIVVYGRRWKEDDTSGTFILIVVAFLPLANLVIIGWLIGDIIKEIKKGVRK